MAQATTKRVSTNVVMRDPVFKTGVSDFHAKKWNRELSDDPIVSWRYERGRLFAAATGIRHITSEGGVVDEDLRGMFVELRKRGDII